ncbi:MAG: Sir2 family NAD-dependent protein deacetylase [Kiritimatiellia bacterium]
MRRVRPPLPGRSCLRKIPRRRPVPACPCGGWLKPAVISFGQSPRAADLERAAAAASGADLFIALGTTLSVQPASLLGFQMPRAAARPIL